MIGRNRPDSILQSTSYKHAHQTSQAPTQPSPLIIGMARVWAFCIGAPRLVAKPRAQCHRLTLDVKGIPKRMLQSSLHLQLGHLTGLPCFGFAWRLVGQQAEVWYWAEDPQALKGGELPCPEPLLRPRLTDGLHLIKCLDGFEAMSIKAGATRKTRWFATQPTELNWMQFARDAGVDAASLNMPAFESVQLLEKPPKAWQLVSSSIQSVSVIRWAVWAMVTALGAIFFALLTYNIKLVLNVNDLRKDYDVLAQQAASTLKLQREIASLQQPIEQIAQSQPKVLQIKLMAQLAQAGLFDEATKVNLQEWEYRNDRIRVQFTVPADGFELGEFLESIERLKLFMNVRLLPGTPPQSVAFQAELAPLRGAP